MPVPMELQHASDDFERLLARVQDLADFPTRNPAYTTVEAVLKVFRRRLSVRDALRFADVLPPILRAIYVTDWDSDAPVAAFADRATLAAEVQAFRQHHNFAPDNAIAIVAQALREQVDAVAFDRVLATLPAGVADYWAVTGES